MTFVRIASAATLAVMLLEGCSPGVDTAVDAGAGGGRASFSAVSSISIRNGGSWCI